MFLERINQSDSTKIYFEHHFLSNEFPTITLVNGHTRTSKDFRLMIKALNTANINVVTLDNRGAGQTTNLSSFTISDMAEDVIEIWNHLEIDKSHLLGISMGGMIAQYISSNLSTRVQSLVLISTASGNHRINSNDGWGETYEEILDKMKGYVSSQFFTKNKLLVEAMAKQTHKAVVAGEFLEGADAQRKALSGFNAKLDLEPTDVPTLIIHGSEDQIISSEAADELRKSIANSELKIYEDAGHLLLAEAPKRLYQDIIDFVKQA